MTDEEALRAAVLAAPDDDTPRLVYADWCDDAGDPDRAAFIRAQVEAARAEPWSPAAREAEARAAVLQGRYELAWYTATGGLGGLDLMRRPDVRRGFVEGAELYTHDFPDLLAAARTFGPVRRVRLAVGPPWEIDLDDPRRSTHRVLQGSHLCGVSALDLAPSEIEGTVEFDAVAEAPHLSGLTELGLSRRPVPPDWLARFLAGPHLPALAALDLSDIPNLGPALATGLTLAAHRRFTKLNVSGVRFLSGELQRVLASRALAEVEELRLGWSFPGPGPLTMLDIGWVMPWARLRLLDVSGQQLGADGVKEIVRKREASALRWLGLARNGLGSAGAVLLVGAPHLRLYHLDVSDNGLAPRDLAALRARFAEAVVVG